MNEYYNIVALARLAGVKGTNEEVYQKFLAACDEAAKMDDGEEIPKVKVTPTLFGGNN